VGKNKIDLRTAEEIVRDILQKNIRATNAEIGSALGVCAETARRILQKLSVSGSPDVQELINRRYAEVRSRWWVRRDVSPAEMVCRIKSLAEKLGRVPRIADAGHLAFRAIEVFGTWNAALAAAGLPLRRVTLPGDPGERREVLVSALKEAAGELGRVPTAKEYDRIVRERSLPKSHAVTGFFGSWRNALEAAGLVRSSVCEVQEAVERVLSGGKRYVSTSEIKGLPPGAKALIRSKVMVLKTKKRMVTWLNRAAEAGFPEVPGYEKGREFAVRVASGETYTAIGSSEGLSGERVRQIMYKYLWRVVRGTGNNGAVLACRTRRELSASGFPEVPGLEEARLLAERFVSGETYESIAESTGLPWWRIKHLIGKYAACVVGGKKPRGLWAGIDRDTAAGYVLKAVRDLGRIPTRREYDDYRRAAGGPPSHVLVRIFGSWRGVLGAVFVQHGGVPGVATAGYEETSVPEGMQL
jgi:hypothetical protein